MWISKEGDVRKQELIDASLEVFSEIGYKRASINNILKKVGVTKGSFYYYFKSKEEILTAAASQQADELVEIIKEASESKKYTLQKINNVFIKMLQYRIENIKKKSQLLVLILSEENVLLNFKIFQIVLEKTKPILGKIITEGVVEGVFTVTNSDEAAEMCIINMNILKNTIFNLFSNGNGLSEENKTLIEKKVVFYEESINRLLGVQGKQIIFSEAMLEYINIVFTKM
jgi:AcrR family transcriptional regulator